jgi:hypothetical protein
MIMLIDYGVVSDCLLLVFTVLFKSVYVHLGDDLWRQHICMKMVLLFVGLQIRDFFLGDYFSTSCEPVHV